MLLHAADRSRPSMGPSIHGFTLIELMIVVVVIAILVAVGYPSYQQYVMRANRADAQALMLHIANQQQLYLRDARQYSAVIGAGGLNIAPQGWTCGAQCTNAHYSISVQLVAGPPPTYTITATALGPQASDGNLSLDSAGNKQPVGKWR
jgi:type IV pilus assembly protein PilE